MAEERLEELKKLEQANIEEQKRLTKELEERKILKQLADVPKVECYILYEVSYDGRRDQYVYGHYTSIKQARMHSTENDDHYNFREIKEIYLPLKEVLKLRLNITPEDHGY